MGVVEYGTISYNWVQKNVTFLVQDNGQIHTYTFFVLQHFLKDRRAMFLKIYNSRLYENSRLCWKSKSESAD